MNLYARLTQAADPAARALRVDGRTVAYRDLDLLSARAAGALRTFGVRPGDRVAAQVDKSLPALTTYFGALRIGAVWTPLNTAYTPSEVAGFVEDAEPSLLLLDAEPEQAFGARTAVLSADGGGAFGEALATAEPDPTLHQGEPGDPGAIVYTSGTTGRSKGAVLSQGALLWTAEALVDAWGFTADDVLLHALPLHHVHGLFLTLHPALRAGASLILQPKFDAAAVLAALPEATVFSGVPTYYTRLLAEPGLTREACARVRLFVSGSAPLAAETFREWERRTGQAPLERYGMTETGVIASNPLNGERRPGWVGRPLPGVEVRVAAEPGEPGGIEVRGLNLLSEYWRRPEQTAAEFRPDGFFVTGDVGRMDADGWLEIVGRAKDLVISGGLNVYPKELETVLDSADGVTESAVFGVPHPDFGEAVVAVLTTSGDTDAARSAAEALARERLASFKRPKALFVLDELPRNVMGKVQKAELRRRYADLFTKEA